MTNNILNHYSINTIWFWVKIQYGTHKTTDISRLLVLTV